MARTNSTVEYRDVPGFPGYRVGNDGTIWSCRWWNKKRLEKGAWKKLSPSTSKKGYKRVVLKLAFEHRLVHRLVLETFIGPCPPGMQACHKNGKRYDNRLSNLRWDTQQNNEADKKRHGTNRSGRRKLTSEDVRQIREDYLLGRGVAPVLAKKYGMSAQNIHTIAQKKTWKHVT